MKKITKILSCLFGFVLAFMLLVGCDVQSEKEESLSYISMRINPEIELVVDEDGDVVEVNAVNEDGQTVMSQIEFVGMSVEEAGEVFTSLAIELGYIDVEAEEATVYILTDGENQEFIDELEEKVTEKIHELFDKKGIFGKVDKEDLEELKDIAEEWNVSLKEVKMINRILELYPEMTVEEILEMSFEERIELIKDDSKKNGLTPNLRKEFNDTVEEIKNEFEALFILRKELKVLEKRLADESISDEEKVTLQAEYDEKKEKYEALLVEYENSIENAKEDKREKVEEELEELKENAEKRREEFKDKVDEHQEKVEKNHDEIKDKINDWRKGHKK